MKMCHFIELYLFKYVRVLLIDEVSMMSAQLLASIDARLKQITGFYDQSCGGIDVVLIGDLRQLPRVMGTPIYKQIKRSLAGATLWQQLHYSALDCVMRQSDEPFSKLLTRVGDGSVLLFEQQKLIESRMFTVKETEVLCPNGIRLYYSNAHVNSYNAKKLFTFVDKVQFMAKDIINVTDCQEEMTRHRTNLHKLEIIKTGGLPYEITFEGCLKRSFTILLFYNQY